MKFLVKIIALTAMAMTSTFSVASADDMRIALVVKALGIGFFEAAAKVQKKPLKS